MLPIFVQASYLCTGLLSLCMPTIFVRASYLCTGLLSLYMLPIFVQDSYLCTGLLTLYTPPIFVYDGSACQGGGSLDCLFFKRTNYWLLVQDYLLAVRVVHACDVRRWLERSDNDVIHHCSVRHLTDDSSDGLIAPGCSPRPLPNSVWTYQKLRRDVGQSRVSLHQAAPESSARTA